ncbi:queuosine precursor transporter [Chitinophaga horti]|uniref:Probable queuosine precursor transporter n=1 Tax=Chitinophaga horti TaxID=2920382 RepID=A0ABY6J8G2_9BACT|nr:queuosine precursor transporter [Chitinophaga horti]UYQ95892.1 queuosine precursor transporter [Chitinophaga horti]
MIADIIKHKPTRLFVFFACFFVANALIAESIGGKIFVLEAWLGLPVHTFTLMGQSGLSFSLTCGVLLWPLEFVVTDIVNEYYGKKAVKVISWVAVALISYAFLMFYISIGTPPADWWIASKVDEGVPDFQNAFAAVFGQGMGIIIGSITAFLVAQIVDVTVFHKIKQKTGEKHLWLRATGSTVISQLVDSFIVLYIAFKVFGNWTWPQLITVMCVNYVYKFVVAVLLTPVIYWIERPIERYLGKETAAQMKASAMEK